MQFTSAQNYSLQISEINHSSIPGNHFVQGMVSMKYLGFLESDINLYHLSQEVYSC
jgi:hypothetical protein